MDTATQPQATLREALPWVKLTLDYTDELAALVPEDQLDWRPVDPSGKFSFSLAELIKHVSDSRLSFISQLTGDESANTYWADEPGEDGVWKFSAHKDKAEVLARLAETRNAVEAWLDQPAMRLMEVTDGTRATFAKILAQVKEAGKPTDEIERRGPATVNRVLMALAVHEAGHRGTLQALLRQQGINASGME